MLKESLGGSQEGICVVAVGRHARMWGGCSNSAFYSQDHWIGATNNARRETWLAFCFGKIAKLVLELSAKGQLRPRTMKKSNLVLQLHKRESIPSLVRGELPHHHAMSPTECEMTYLPLLTGMNPLLSAPHSVPWPLVDGPAVQHLVVPPQ